MGVFDLCVLAHLNGNNLIYQGLCVPFSFCMPVWFVDVDVSTGFCVSVL